MANYPQGSVLTCAHDGCDCRVEIKNECHCSSAESGTYRCACGAEMVPVS